MKKVGIKILLNVFLGTLAVSSLKAFDLPVFYRTPYSDVMLKHQRKNWETELSARYGVGHSSHSRASTQKKSSLFGFVGPVALTQLGKGLDINQDTQPKTYEYWNTTDGTFKDGNEDSGLVDFKGSLNVQEIAFDLRQQFFSGFFVQVYVPLRTVKVHNVAYALRDKSSFNAIDFNDFIGGDFATILEENGYSTAYDSAFKKSGVSDLAVSLGWCGYDDQSFNTIDAASGSIQVGLVAPIQGKKNQDHFAALSLGNDDFWGCFARFKAEIGLWEILSFGAQAGLQVFLPAERTVRMHTDKSQSGLLVLEKGRTKVDLGSIWDLSAYVTAYRFLGGLSCSLGYSFTKQEHTHLHVVDDQFLKTVVDAGLQADPKRFISKDDIVNHDERFQGWDQHVMHAVISYDVAAHRSAWFAPLISCEYAYQVVGRRVMNAHQLAGTCGFTMSWVF